MSIVPRFMISYRNDDFYQFIDVIMIFGASISAQRITIRRSSLDDLPKLAWVVVMIEDHGIPMSLIKRSDRLTYQSKQVNFLGPAVKRWYDGGIRRIPADIIIDDNLLALWALSSIDVSYNKLEFNCDGTSVKLREYLVDTIRTTIGLSKTDVERDDKVVRVNPSCLPVVMEWMSNKIPRSVFDARYRT